MACALLPACESGRRPVAPDPAPTPTPTPEPAPTPTPEPSPAVFGCGIPRGTGIGRGCPREYPHYDGHVEDAINKVVEDFPEWFDFRRARGGPTNYRVRYIPGYVDEVVYNLRVMGLCALNDGEEIAVKHTNDFSDQYDIITSDSFIRRGLSAYRVTCRPAWNSIPP